MMWRKTKEYRLWRALVIRRDKCCVICFSSKTREAHHLNHASFYPEERFIVENGVTLCKECHSQFHTNYHKSTKEKCTKETFSSFNELFEYFKQKVINVKPN